MIDIQGFVDWQAEDKTNRTLSIDIKMTGAPEIWVYDHAVGAGQFVKSPGEIDLVAKRKQDLEVQIRLLTELEEKEKRSRKKAGA